MTAPAVTFDRVTKRYRRGAAHDALRDVLASMAGRGRARDEFLALDDVSFTVARGEALGIVGPNGSGKSTALKLMTGILLPTSGGVAVDGRIAPLIEVGAGFHPDLSGRENVWLNAAIMGMTKAEARAVFDEIVAFSGLAEFIDTPVKRYSSGMYMRLGFSIAAHMPADVLIVDEVLAVGDVGFRAKCLDKMSALKRGGRTILFVSHHSHQVRTLCDRVVYLKHGKKVFDGDTVEGTQRYVTESMAESRTEGAAASAPDASVRIDSATLFRDGAAADEPLPTGGSLEVAVRYTVLRPMNEPPILSIALVRADGVTACVLNTRERGVVLDATPGEHAIVARFDALPLYALRHHAEAILWDAPMVTILTQSAAGEFDVSVPPAALINRYGAFWPQGSFRKGGN